MYAAVIAISRRRAREAPSWKYPVELPRFAAFAALDNSDLHKLPSTDVSTLAYLLGPHPPAPSKVRLGRCFQLIGTEPLLYCSAAVGAPLLPGRPHR